MMRLVGTRMGTTAQEHSRAVVSGDVGTMTPPKPYYQDDHCTIYCGDCREILPTLDPQSCVSVVTDPPYGLSFMGKKWDYEVPSVAIWEAVFAALKPGGHLLAFAGTRTQHRMAVRIEDAGFDIRDMIAWVYGSGFPKSLDVSKAIDKAAGAEREKVRVKPRPETSGTMSGKADTRPWIEKSRELGYHEVDGNIPATPEAIQWSGWGTALKPALEPITMARKPIDGTLAANTVRHGCGGINVDGCRVALNGDYKCKPNGRPSQTGLKDNYNPAKANEADTAGRWPANLVHDGSDEVVGLFPESNGQQGKVTGKEPSSKTNAIYGDFNGRPATNPREDSGSAARFFYCAKASDREILPAEEHPLFKESYAAVNNTHPTVKPVDLMRWLIRLVTPPTGVLLDPFMGSGTTLVAAKMEGRRAIGIEINPEYCEIAANRLRQNVLNLQEAPTEDSLT